MKKWTHDEENTLLEMKNSGSSLSEIAEILGRSYSSVKTRSTFLVTRSGAGENKNWSTEQVGALYGDYDFDELVQITGKSRSSIVNKCFRLGIVKKDLPSGSRTKGSLDEFVYTTLYLVDFGDFKKVGVCQVPLNERFRKDELNYIVLDTCEMSLEEALNTEAEILRNMRAYRTKGKLRKGFYECFDYPCSSLEDLL